MKRCLLVAVLLLGLLIPVWAQSTPSGSLPASLTAQFVHPFSLSIGVANFSHYFWASSGESMHLAIALPGDGFVPTLYAPSGAAFTWDENSTVISYVKIPIRKDEQSLVVGYAYHITLNASESGRWTLNATSGSPIAKAWTGVLTVDFDSKVNAGLFSTKQQAILGQSVAVSLAVVDGSTMRYDFQYDARLIRAGDPATSAQPVTFASVPSATGGCPTLVATLQPSEPGAYNLIVYITGNTSLGPFERSVASGFVIYPQKAKLTGQFTQRTEISFPEPPK